MSWYKINSNCDKTLLVVDSYIYTGLTNVVEIMNIINVLTTVEDEQY